jgi:5'-3' exoribonuclease 1
LDHQGNLIPDPDADYYLFDRIINVSTTNAVPFGLRGTVIGIYGGMYVYTRAF